jgi:hypothetical protein
MPVYVGSHMSTFAPPSEHDVPLTPNDSVGNSPRGFQRWPLWAKIAGPIVALLVVVSAAGALTNKDNTGAPATTDATSGVQPLAGVADTLAPATTVTTVAPTAAAPTTLPPTTLPPTTLPPTVPPTVAPTVAPTIAPTVPPTAAPIAPPPTAAPTDPRFDTCKEAKANGYGPYVRGQDPEYGWYRDADSDGTVCE